MGIADFAESDWPNMLAMFGQSITHTLNGSNTSLQAVVVPGSQKEHDQRGRGYLDQLKITVTEGAVTLSRDVSWTFDGSTYYTHTIDPAIGGRQTVTAVKRDVVSKTSPNRSNRSF